MDNKKVISCAVCDKFVEDQIGYPQLRIHVAVRHFPGYRPYVQPCCGLRFSDPVLAKIPRWCCQNHSGGGNNQAKKVREGEQVNLHIEKAIQAIVVHSELKQTENGQAVLYQHLDSLLDKYATELVSDVSEDEIPNQLDQNMNPVEGDIAEEINGSHVEDDTDLLADIDAEPESEQEGEMEEEKQVSEDSGVPSPMEPPEILIRASEIQESTRTPLKSPTGKKPDSSGAAESSIPVESLSLSEKKDVQQAEGKRDPTMTEGDEKIPIASSDVGLPDQEKLLPEAKKEEENTEKAEESQVQDNLLLCEFCPDEKDEEEERRFSMEKIKDHCMEDHLRSDFICNLKLKDARCGHVEEDYPGIVTHSTREHKRRLKYKRILRREGQDRQHNTSVLEFLKNLFPEDSEVTEKMEELNP